MLKAYWSYFKYVIEHKINVFKTCWAKGLYVHAFMHDMSKFHPKEFFAYSRYFYISKDKYKAEFDEAWKHHYKNNPHHWEFWLDSDNVAYLMPEKYIKQMIADWQGMALKFSDTAQAFYLKNYKRINIHYISRANLEWALGLNDSVLHNYGHTLEEFANMYDEETYNSYFGYIKDVYGVDSYALLKNGGDH